MSNSSVLLRPRQLARVEAPYSLSAPYSFTQASPHERPYLDRSVVHVLSTIDDALQSNDECTRQCTGHSVGRSMQPSWRRQLQRAIRRMQKARGEQYPLPGRREVQAARELLGRTGVPPAWRLAIMPDGEGGLEVRFLLPQSDRQLSVIVAEGELSLTSYSMGSTRSEFFTSLESLSERIASEL